MATASSSTIQPENLGRAACTERTVIPLTLQLSPEQVVGNDDVNASPSSLDAVVNTIEQLAQKGELDSALARHGTLLFRGLPIENADDFSRFAHAFGYEPHEIIGIVVDRPLLAKNVAPANESSLTTTIGSHNESPQVPHGEIPPVARVFGIGC